MKRFIVGLLVLTSFPVLATVPKITCYSTIYGVNTSGLAYNKEFMLEDIELKNRPNSDYLGTEYHYEFKNSTRYKMIVVGGYDPSGKFSEGMRIHLEDTKKDVQSQSWAQTNVVSLDYNAEYSANGTDEERVNIHCHIKRAED